MAESYTVQQLAKLAGDFVVKKRGVWEHEDWQQLCASVEALGLILDEDLRTCLGMLLESLKVFYASCPKRPKTAAKRKPRAKSKAKAKAKTKAAPRVKASAKNAGTPEPGGEA